MQLSTHIARMAVLPLALGVAVAGLGMGVAAQTAHAEASASTLAALSDAQARYAAATQELDSLYQQVYEAQGAYEATTAQLDSTNQAIADTQALIADQKAQLEEAQDILADRLGADYRAGEANMLDVIFSATSFEDLVSRIYYAGKISDADAQAIQDVKDIKAALEASEAQLQEQRAEQEQLQAQQAADLQSLNEQTDACAAYVASLDYEVQSLYAQAQAEAQAAAQAASQQVAAAAQQQMQEVISAAEDAGYHYDESTGDWSDSSGNTVSSDTVSNATGYDVSSIISTAQSYIGTNYVLGGESYGGIDCSGLTSAAYGGSLPHYSGDQYDNVVSNGSYTSDIGSLNPGDLVFYTNSSGNIYHVALYVGNGQVIDAIPNGGVQLRDYNYVDGYIGGGTPSV